MAVNVAINVAGPASLRWDNEYRNRSAWWEKYRRGINTSGRGFLKFRPGMVGVQWSGIGDPVPIRAGPAVYGGLVDGSVELDAYLSGAGRPRRIVGRIPRGRVGVANNDFQPPKRMTWKPQSKGPSLQNAVTSLRTAQLRLVRLLGSGGQGAVALFDTTTPAGVREFFAVKFVFANTPLQVARLATERAMMLNFNGSEHLTQIIDTPAASLALGAPGNPNLFYMMEYCPGGTMKNVLHRLVSQPEIPGLSWPLWHMFDCLFRMAVAMNFPIPNSNNIPPAGTTRLEMFPPQPVNQAAENYIHFDIDPSNIFIGEAGNPTLMHPFPIPKLADFGSAELANANFLCDYRELMKSWQKGKPNLSWFPPEQFTEEWKYWRVPGLDPPAAVNAARAALQVPGQPAPATQDLFKIAGKYSWKTNMWCLAYTMWSVITRRHPPKAPKPELMPRIPANQPAHLPPAGNVNQDGGPPTMVTYGAYVLSNSDPTFNTIDRDLRTLVARCLAANPADRPDMAAIEATLIFKLNPANIPREETPAVCRNQWTRKIFQDAPNPRVQSMAANVNSLAQWMNGNRPLPPRFLRVPRQR